MSDIYDIETDLRRLRKRVQDLEMPSAVPTKRTGASFARGASRQDYSTPESFILAVKGRFGPIDFDLAATVENTKAARWYGPGGVAVDALQQDWTKLQGNLWLNPPFGNIAPWAAKCAVSHKKGRGLIYALLPASVGAGWFDRYVNRQALVLGLVGRLTFDGQTTPYPKDLILAVWGVPPSFDCWRWRT